MDHTYIAEKLREQFDVHIRSIEESYGMLDIIVQKEKMYEIIKWLKVDTDLQFNFLTDLCGAHYPEKNGEELSVIYHMHSFKNNIRIRLHCFFSEKESKTKSITDLFASANWMERETFDFFGIHFIGHPDLRRILNMDEMDYFPLLKQYPLEDGTRTDKEDKYFGRN